LSSECRDIFDSWPVYIANKSGLCDVNWKVL
jgi:hypothetical protein